MSDGPGRDESAAGPDLRKLAQDWITLWQSELAGLAVDREAQETWQAMLALWAGAAAAMLRAMPRDDAAGGDACRSPRHPSPPPQGGREQRMSARTDAPGPLQRRGPRPLLLHLTLAMLRSTVSRAASPHWKHGWPNSNEAIAAAIRDALAQEPGRRGPAENPARGFPGAVLAETLRQDAALIEGIAAYRRHPWRRDMPDPPAIWQEGGSRLLDYGGDGPAGAVRPQPGEPRLRAGPGARPLDAALAGGPRRRTRCCSTGAGRARPSGASP